VKRIVFLIIISLLVLLCSCTIDSEIELKPSVVIIEEDTEPSEEEIKPVVDEDEIETEQVEKEIETEQVENEEETETTDDDEETETAEDEEETDPVDDEIETEPATDEETEPVEEDTEEEQTLEPQEPIIEKYPLHKNIMTTYFWIGEDASDDNSWISNHHSAWDELWVEHYGGIDDPDCREDYYPCDFVPNENPFYCALPYSDYDSDGLKSNIDLIPWYDIEKGIDDELDESLIKNRWIKIMFNHNGVDKEAYCQWEDAGPGSSDDTGYVFGDAMPVHENEIGLDVSPAVRDYLGLDGMDLTDWQFVDDEDVEEGPWLDIVTNSNACWIYEGSPCNE